MGELGPYGISPCMNSCLEEPRGVLEAALAAAVLAEHGADLDVEIGVVLGGRPDREDQVVGVGAA